MTDYTPAYGHQTPYDISFADLRNANIRRLPQFKNRRGEPVHTEPDGSDWSLNDWYTAVSGEVGELGNVLKKVRSGELTLNQTRLHLEEEIADIVCYLDLLLLQISPHKNLGVVTRSKFNAVSDRIGSNVKI